MKNIKRVSRNSGSVRRVGPSAGSVERKEGVGVQRDGVEAQRNGVKPRGKPTGTVIVKDKARGIGGVSEPIPVGKKVQPSSPMGNSSRKEIVRKKIEREELRGKLLKDREEAISRGVSEESWDMQFGGLLREGRSREDIEIESWADYEKLKQEVLEERQERLDKAEERFPEPEEESFEATVYGDGGGKGDDNKPKKGKKKKGYEVNSEEEARRALRKSALYMGLVAFLVVFLVLVAMLGGPKIFESMGKSQEQAEKALDAKSKELDEKGVTLDSLLKEVNGEDVEADKENHKKIEALKSVPPEAGEKTSVDGSSVTGGYNAGWEADSVKISKYMAQAYPFTEGSVAWKVGERNGVSDVEMKSNLGSVFQVASDGKGGYLDNAQVLFGSVSNEWLGEMTGEVWGDKDIVFNSVDVEIDGTMSNKVDAPFKDSSDVFGRCVNSVNISLGKGVLSTQDITDLFTAVDSQAADIKKTFRVKVTGGGTGKRGSCFSVMPNGVASSVSC